VTVLPGHDSQAWLDGLRTGRVGRDYGAALGREVESLAVQRDREAIKAGRLIKWLAKAG
jgi:hypothetical protein